MQHQPNPQSRHDSALGNVISLDLTLSDNTAHQIAVKVAAKDSMHSQTYTVLIYFKTTLKKTKAWKGL